MTGVRAPASGGFDPERELSFHMQGFAPLVEAAEADQAGVFVSGVEHREIAPGHIVAKVIGLLVAEGTAAFLRQLCGR